MARVAGAAKITVTSNGTKVPISASTKVVEWFTFQSDPLNVGTYVYIKDSSGNICATITKGQSFTPPQPTTAGIDLSQVFIDSDTNGDGGYVCYTD